MAVVIALFFDENTSSTPLWIVLGCSTLLGIGVGYLISRDTAQKIGVGILGILLGYVLGEFLFSLIIVRFSSDENNNKIIYYVTIVVCCILLGIIGFFAKDLIEIISTSVFGAFAACRAAGLIFGGYPDYDTLIKEITDEDFGSVIFLNDNI